jgi:KaiC/GvpD/RAD55 family RecA-like ATPase
MYDLSDVIDVPALTAVDPGTCILVSGPAMTGTTDLVLDMLASGAHRGEGVVAVTTNDDASGAIESILERASDVEAGQLAAIDCRGEGTDDETAAGAYVYHAGAPSDLTGMGIGITQSFERIEDFGVDRGRLALSSLSTMLTYTDRQTVFKFCHVLSSRIHSAGFVGAFTIDSSAHEAQTLQVVKQPFDGLIEVREQGGTREARVMGVEPDPSEWVGL